MTGIKKPVNKLQETIDNLRQSLDYMDDVMNLFDMDSRRMRFELDRLEDRLKIRLAGSSEASGNDHRA